MLSNPLFLEVCISSMLKNIIDMEDTQVKVKEKTLPKVSDCGVVKIPIRLSIKILTEALKFH